MVGEFDAAREFASVDHLGNLSPPQADIGREVLAADHAAEFSFHHLSLQSAAGKSRDRLYSGQGATLKSLEIRDRCQWHPRAMATLDGPAGQRIAALWVPFMTGSGSE